jgi:hypothetical protein
LPVEHWASEAQVAPQLAEVPVHRYGPHAGLPSLPAATREHVPTLPGTLHALQAPAQAVLQHTPSTQLPLPHWLFAVHAPAFVFFGTQAPASQ